MTSENVSIVEVGPRDGLQNVVQQLPTALKIDLIKRLSLAGLSNIELTSVVSSKAVPQLQDCRQVLQSRPVVDLLQTGTGRYLVLAPNLKGVQIAHQHGAREVAVFISATEGFSKANTNCTVAEGIERARESAQEARRLGMTLRGYVSCIFTDPFDGITAPAAVLHIIQALLSMDCYEISLGDTTGIGSPADVRRLITYLKSNDVPLHRIAGHFHDTYGQALANVWEAYTCGIRTFDSSIAGLGGCPFAPGAKGNVATEDVVYMFRQAGVTMGDVNLHKLVEVGSWISSQLSQKYASRAGVAIASKQADPAAKAHIQRHDLSKPARLSWTLLHQMESLIIQRSGANLKITMDRPKNGNALTLPMIHGLSKTLSDAAEDNAISRVAIVGNGKFFCTGMDLGKTSTLVGGEDSTADAQFERLKEMFDTIDRHPKVTIACINGPAFGGGVGLALACDIRLSVKRASLTLSEAKLGLCPATISKYVIRELGVPWAREAMLSARTISADELKDRGVISRLADNNSDLMAMLDSFTSELGVVSSDASRMCKDLVQVGWSDAGKAKQDAAIKRLFKEMMHADGAGRYGVQEFQAGRKVDWDRYVSKQSTSTESKL